MNIKNNTKKLQLILDANRQEDNGKDAIKEFHKMHEYIIKLEAKVKNLTIPGVSPYFSKEELGEVYQIGFNHGKNVAPFQKDRIIQAYCDADELNRNINWE